MHKIFIVVLIILSASCANIVPPSGGKKDVTPPKLLNVTPKDSLLNTKVSKLILTFNEYIQINDPANQITISPLFPIPLNVTKKDKQVIIKMPDSLLKDNTTYRISFANGIGDLHENNLFKNYVFTFSTGSYFDTESIAGQVFIAATGLPDSTSVVELYEAKETDTAVVRKRPEYITHLNSDGTFKIAGLPSRKFRVYALKDANANLIYDGNPELIAFLNDPIDASKHQKATLRLFEEKADSSKKNTTTAPSSSQRGNGEGARSINFSYTLNVDTADIRKRSKEITEPITISFNHKLKKTNSERLFLSYDSLGIAVQASIKTTTDTVKQTLIIGVRWKENSFYTLRLLKGFATDSAGADALPSRYSFRTKREEDYAKIDVRLPGKYLGKTFLLQVNSGTDTVYQKTITDTTVKLVYLKPGNYNLRVIEDANQNGKWDSGDLFAHVQPEIVIPYLQTITMKPGWENVVDFEPKNTKTNQTVIDRPGSVR